MAELLPNPMARRTLTKASRQAHPGEPVTSPNPTPETPHRPASTGNRLGPNRVRKSLYLPADVAATLEAEVNRIHHASQGRVSKAAAAGAIIRNGLDHLDEVEQGLTLITTRTH